MKKEKENRGSRNIAVKVLTAIGLSILVLFAAIYITKQTFSKVNDTISNLAKHNAKTAALNNLYSEFGNFERHYQSPLIANPTSKTDRYFAALDSIKNLIDSTSTNLNFSENEKLVLDSIVSIIDEQNTRLLTYRVLKRNEQPLLEENLDSLINLITDERVMSQPDVITTRKSTRRIPVDTDKDEPDESTESKKNIFQRIFSGDNDKAADKREAKKPEIVEETYIRVDTVPSAKSDTSKKKAGVLIKNIERQQAIHQRRIRRVETSILQGSAEIQNFILDLIRSAEEEELAQIHTESGIAKNMMQEALGRMYFVLGIFGIVATILVLLILSDLSKAKYYRRQLIAAKEKAENLSRIKERFLANMSHEIRTPLQNILGYSERLAAKEENQDAKIIHQSSEHLLQIVNQVLDFSRISTGKLILHPTNFNLAELLNEVVGSMKIQADKKEIRLISEVFLQEKEVFADPFRIRQILYNLLGNAIKFTSEGFVSLRAENEHADGKIIFRFSIEDTGIGMNHAEIERLFEEFEQADTPNHATTGTGLGLSISKALIETYDGQIQVKSDEGSGSTFDVELRLVPPQKAQNAEDNLKGRQRMQTVLLVDDDRSILELTEEILREHKIDVTATHSPNKAIEISQKNGFDIALVDYRMPEMTGAELCVELKKLHPKMPVIAVTANVLKTDSQNKNKEPFDGFLPKPFKTKELLKLLGHSEKKDEAKSSGENLLNQKLETITMGDNDLKKELIQQFKTDCKLDIRKINQGLEQSNLTQVREHIHRLGGRLGFFELTESTGNFHRLESELENDKWSADSEIRLRQSIRKLESEIQKI